MLHAFSYKGWLIVLFLGTVAGVLQFSLFMWALRWLPPTTAVLYLMLNPITADDAGDHHAGRVPHGGIDRRHGAGSLRNYAGRGSSDDSQTDGSIRRIAAESRRRAAMARVITGVFSYLSSIVLGFPEGWNDLGW